MRNEPAATPRADAAATGPTLVTAPAIALPKGGGAIRGIGEKFASNPVTGTGSMSVPIATSPGRGGFGPQLALSYDSGAGNGIFGLGWNLSLPFIARKTEKGLPRYRDGEESDVFILAGVEDLVPVLDAAGSRPAPVAQVVHEKTYLVYRYRPRIEGTFALIERWVDARAPRIVFWRMISRDNVTTWFGSTDDSRVADPDDPSRVFQWNVSETHDDMGNAVAYAYAREDEAGVDGRSPGESNRTSAQRTASCHPDRIRYGNVVPYVPAVDAAGAQWQRAADLPGQSWLFEVVFDYGNHPGLAPSTTPTAAWTVRKDPFSSHRAGFEVRTYRLCRRVLMFHHFQQELGAADYLVRSTDFAYDEPGDLADPTQPGYTLLRRVVQWAFEKRQPTDNVYERRQLPPVDFTYSVPKVDPAVRTIDPAELENLPVGTHGPGYRWIDLDGEGLSGVLTEQAGAWFYKPNLGDGRFGPTRTVASRPAMAALNAGQQQLLDLAGDGGVSLVDFNGQTPGYHQRTSDEGWTGFAAFSSLPNVDFDDRNLRFVDLTGDGRADALIARHEDFLWYRSLGVDGFDAAQRRALPQDEEDGPRLVFSDGTQTIFLADMSGDGLTDLVRIRNRDACFWPNLGYGRFGRKVVLGNAPLFDHDELFDARRIRLTDIDGSGPVDVIYLGRDGARLYFNRGGNGLSDGQHVDLPVATSNLGSVQAADLLGNGTACLVWSSELPADARQRVRYIDLMAGTENPVTRRRHEKPYLLIGVDNNLGGTTEIEYAPSTRFYLDDKRKQEPWATRLPFPVNCVRKVITRDKWRRTTFSSTYSYHHGYYDGLEREFRGFGRVEQVDVESFGSSAENNVASPFVTQDRTLYQPPVKTIMWFHTGASLDRERILHQQEHEYFPQRFAGRIPDPAVDPGAFRERACASPELPASLGTAEWHEALRACKGRVLRQEVLELDVDDLAVAAPRETPVRIYTAAVRDYRIRQLQARGNNAHAVFIVDERETLTYHYDLALPRDGSAVKPDPRVAHSLTLRTDEQGNPQQSIAVAYGRWRPADQGTRPDPQRIADVQAELHVAYSETRYTGDVMLPPAANVAQATRHYRLRMPCETLTYELANIPRGDAHYYSIADFDALDLSEVYGHRAGETAPAGAVARKEYHQLATGAAPQQRLVEHARSLFFDDGRDDAPPTAPLAFGQLGPRGLGYEDYHLALTDALLDAVFTERDTNGNVVDDKLAWERAPAAGGQPAVLARDILDEPIAAGSSYLRSGYAVGTDVGAPAGQYWTRSGVAGFAANAQSRFFLPERYTDPFGSVTTVTYDAHLLFSASSTDARHNTTSVAAFDYRVLAARELVDPNGNRVEGAFDIRGMVVATAVKGKQVGGQWQGDDLAALTFDLANPSPAAVAAFCTAADADRTQAATWLAGATSRFVYHLGDDAGVWAARPAGACAIARERHASQVAADPAHVNPLHIGLECSDGHGQMLMTKVQAEPGDDGSTRWLINGLTLVNNKGKPVRQYEPSFVPEFGFQLPQAFGVTSTLYYDAAGRLVRTEFPDGSTSRVELSPWEVTTYDRNDEVKHSLWYRRRLTAAERGVPVAPPTATAAERADALAVDAVAAAASADEKRAAGLAANHAGTPATSILDSLGRDVIVIAHNRTPDDTGVWRDAFTSTYSKLDAEGKALWLRDARGNLVMQYVFPPRPNDDPSDAVPAGAAPCYDVAGNLLYQHGMDAGDRWVLADAAGQPMLGWDANERIQPDGTRALERRLSVSRYDTLHRPVEMWLRLDAAPAALIEAFEYVDVDSFRDAAGVLEQTALAAAQRDNLVGQAVRHYDGSGLSTVERVTFEGALEEITKTLAADASAFLIDWNVGDRTPLLEDETFRQITLHDALGRMTTTFNWHRDSAAGASDRVAVYVPTYNERGLLRSERLYMRAAKSTANGVVSFTPSAVAARSTDAIRDIRWNAKGQRVRLTLGNGTVTRYTYDAETFRLRRLYTRRDARFASDCGAEPPPPRTVAPDTDMPPRECGVQNLSYVYDPAGNVVHVQDDAQPAVFFQNVKVEVSSDYTYDALYRLIAGTGRESAVVNGAPAQAEAPTVRAPFPLTGQTLRTYVQRYRYDAAGNIERMSHVAGTANQNGWTRYYGYAPDSNRLLRTWQGDPDGNSARATNIVDYRHDSHGNLRNLVATAGEYLRWDARDMLGGVDQLGGGLVFYSYGASKQRARKRIERSNVNLVEDRIYLGGLELTRTYRGGALVEEIESLHLMEGDQRVLLVDDVITREGTPAMVTLQRYQYGNHLDSASVELDDQAALASYEEYHPFGTTAYRALRDGVEVPPKRYRYTGMERDEESGLCCHGARYYAPWLGRWTAADPIDVKGGTNLYQYADDAPVTHTDRTGTQTQPATQGGLDKYQNQDTLAGYIREHYANTGTVRLPLKAFLESRSVPAADIKRFLSQVRGNSFTGLLRSDVADVKTQDFDNPRTDAAKLPGYNNRMELLNMSKDTQTSLAFGGATQAEIDAVPGNTKAGYTATIRGEAIARRALDAGLPLPKTIAKALATPVPQVASKPTATPKANVVTFAPKATAKTGGGGNASGGIRASTETETPPGVIKGGAAAEKKGGGGGGGGGGSGAGTATIVGTMMQIALPEAIGGRISSDAMQVVNGVVGVGAEWIETVGPAQALTGLTVAGTMIAPKVGLAVGAVGGSVGTAFGATTLGGIAAGGAGAVAVAAGAVAVAGVAGYAIGTGINKALEASGATALHEKVMEKLGIYDLSYRLFFK